MRFSHDILSMQPKRPLATVLVFLFAFLFRSVRSPSFFFFFATFYFA